MKFIAVFLVAYSAVACGLWVGNPKKPGTEKSSLNLPAILPQVKAATPVALRVNAALNLALPYADLKQRFFAAGPTNIFQILEDFDGRLGGYNSRAADNQSACVTQEPVAYTIEAQGETLTFYAQCYEQLGAGAANDPKLIQFGVKDGKTYLYTAVGAMRAAVIATPSGEDTYDVQAWLGVGYQNAAACGSFDGCSYGVMRLQADSTKQQFEMAVAGVGFGYCGAQLKSDGTAVYAIGSLDGPGCAAPDTLCGTAADLSVAGDCAAISTFALPALGRTAVTAGSHQAAASLYPDSPNVILNGSATDSLDFGPVVPTDGVGSFSP